MNSSFKSNLRMKSSEQLLNMVLSKGQWSNEQLKLIIEEIENRDLINDEIEEIKSGLNPSKSIEEIDLDNPQNEFENDLSIIIKAEQKTAKKEAFKTPALVLLISLAFVYGLILYNVPSVFNLDSRFSEDISYVFQKNIYLFILLFFASIGTFITKLYTLSGIISGFSFILLGILYLFI